MIFTDPSPQQITDCGLTRNVPMKALKRTLARVLTFWNVLRIPDRDISSVVSFTPGSLEEPGKAGFTSVAQPEEAAAALMAPATSSAFLTPEILHLLSIFEESDVPLAFVFNF